MYWYYICYLFNRTYQIRVWTIWLSGTSNHFPKCNSVLSQKCYDKKNPFLSCLPQLPTKELQQRSKNDAAFLKRETCHYSSGVGTSWGCVWVPPADPCHGEMKQNPLVTSLLLCVCRCSPLHREQTCYPSLSCNILSKGDAFPVIPIPEDLTTVQSLVRSKMQWFLS